LSQTISQEGGAEGNFRDTEPSKKTHLTLWKERITERCRRTRKGKPTPLASPRNSTHLSTPQRKRGRKGSVSGSFHHGGGGGGCIANLHRDDNGKSIRSASKKETSAGDVTSGSLKTRKGGERGESREKKSGRGSCLNGAVKLY